MEIDPDDEERTRPPLISDLVGLCRELNERNANAAARTMITPVVVDGVTIPFASPTLLWKTKQTYREKDAIDRSFLRRLLEDRGEWPVK